LRIPFPILAPCILVFATIGTYALRASIVDIYVMFAAGVVGYFMRQSNYSIPAVVMGVILGKIGENVFVQAMVMVDYNVFGFFDVGVSGVCMVSGILTIIYITLRHTRKFFAEMERKD
jgi:putative tricarboxylic transport membrane protein